MEPLREQIIVDGIISIEEQRHDALNIISGRLKTLKPEIISCSKIFGINSRVVKQLIYQLSKWNRIHKDISNREFY